MVGETITDMGWGGAYVHAKCQALNSTASANFLARFTAVRGLAHDKARAVAMHLGSIVTRHKKYMGHSEVCYRAASIYVTDEKWAAAMALVGKTVSKTADVHKTVDETFAAEREALQKALALKEEAFRKEHASQQVNLAEVANIARQAAEAAIQPIIQLAAADLTKKVLTEAVRIAREAAEEVVRASAAPREIVVKVEGKEPKTIAGKVHAQFSRLLKMVGAKVNVWLAGPAGSGKTTAARQVAEALSLPFFFNGAIDTEYKLSGFVDAQGRIVSTAFRRAYTEGGVYLFDEVDASMPSAVLAFNAALSNGHADFPGLDTPVGAHPDFRVIAAGNTWGLGATTEYVGRAKMDAAFLDRFVQLAWGYDEVLERGLATNTKWCERVQALRVKAKTRGLKIVISPRATLNGCRLLDAGLSWSEVEDATVRAKISPTDWANLTN